MSRLPVVFTPEAEAQLAELESFIAERASPRVAARYVDAIIAHCESFGALSLRGTRRDDIRPGLRLTHYRHRTVIAYAPEPTRIVIIGVFYGGRDVPGALDAPRDRD